MDLTVTPDRNVVLIKALNDRGKTTLFKAIKFALYGNDRDARKWINFQSAASGDGEMYVEIKFEHEGKEYRLRRSIEYNQTDEGKEINAIGNPIVDIFDDDGPFKTDESEANKNDWIDTILPRDASQFFFFDGEEIRRYVESEETHVQKAIEKVLGIMELLNGMEDLKSTYRDLDSEYAKNIRAQTRDTTVKNKLSKLRSEIENQREAIEHASEELDAAIKSKEYIKKKQQRNSDMSRLVAERDIADGELTDTKKKIKALEKKLTSDRSYLGLILLSPLLEFIHSTKENPPPIDQWLSQTAQHMLKEELENCVCGRRITDELCVELKSKILDIKPSKESQLKRYVESILITSKPEAKLMELKESLEKISGFTQKKDNLASTIKNYSSQLGSHDSEGLKKLQSDYDAVVGAIGKKEKEIEDLGFDMEKNDQEMKRLERKIESNVVDESLTSSKKRRDMCELLFNSLQKSINRFYEKRKPDLEAHVSQIFSRLTNNPDLYKGIEIDREFNLMILRKDGTKFPTNMYGPSAGGSQVVATSMIGGLNKFATRDAPIVIDTPMGRLDPTHRENIINYYSTMGKQIIILYQPSELVDTDIENITSSLASEWEISSVSDRPDISQIRRTKGYL